MNLFFSYEDAPKDCPLDMLPFEDKACPLCGSPVSHHCPDVGTCPESRATTLLYVGAVAQVGGLKLSA